MHLVRGAHKNERRDDHVERGEARQQDQNSMSIGGQPNVILADEQLQRDASKPGEERRVASAQDARDIPQHHIAHNRDEKDVRMDLLAVLNVAAEERERGVHPDAQQGQQCDRYGGPPRKQISMVIVIEHIVLLGNVKAGRVDHAEGHRIPVQLPLMPPLVQVIVCGHKQCLPRSCHEDPLEEHLRHEERTKFNLIC